MRDEGISGVKLRLCCAAQSLAEALHAPHALPLLDSPALDNPFPTPPAPPIPTHRPVGTSRKTQHVVRVQFGHQQSAAN